MNLLQPAATQSGIRQLSGINQKILLGIFGLFLSSGDRSSAAITIASAPSWYDGSSSTTFVCYTFNTADSVPVAHSFTNPNGAPAGAITLGGISTGWQDPAAPMDLSGTANDGAWDLGTGGYFELTIPVAQSLPGPGESYQIEFQVHGLAYQGISALPSLETVGSTPDSVLEAATLYAPDPGFPGASWQAQIFEGTYNAVNLDEITIRLSAPALNVSVLDGIEVYTRYTVVPEPSMILMVFTGAGMLALLRRPRR